MLSQQLPAHCRLQHSGSRSRVAAILQFGLLPAVLEAVYPQVLQRICPVPTKFLPRRRLSTAPSV